MSLQPAPVVLGVGDILSASDWTIYTESLNYLYGNTSWTAPTLLNSWSNAGSGNTIAGYRAYGPSVQLRGSLSGGTHSAGTALFTLPSGYRPVTYAYNSASATSGGTTVIYVDTSGNVKLGLDPGAVTIFLDNILIPLV